MLKRPELLVFLGPPDDPDRGGLEVRDGALEGAGWPVPIVNGVPDFVTHAPPLRRAVVYEIPMEARPDVEVLQTPPVTETVPPWFEEDSHKYALLDKHPRGLLLDVGSGQGNRGSFERLGYDYVALDVSFNSQQRHSGPSDVDIVADCHRLPMRSRTVEAINATALLEHVFSPPLAVTEMQRVLTPGGLLVGSCSFLEGEHFDSQLHHSHLGLYRLLTSSGLEVCFLYPGLSLWEMHAHSIFLGLPGHRLWGKLLRRIYLALVWLKSEESPERRLLRHAAVLHFVARKPESARSGASDGN